MHLSEGAYIKIRNRAQKKEGAFCALLRLLERETGFGPATSTLARWHSTTESLPQISGFKTLDCPYAVFRSVCRIVYDAHRVLRPLIRR